MFGSLIVGLVFGLGSKFVTEPISEFIAAKAKLSEREMAIVVFGLIMAVAAIVASLVTGNASPFWLIIGGVIGVFGFQLFEFARATLVDAKTDAEKAAEAGSDAIEDAAETVKDTAESVVEETGETVKKAAKKTKSAAKKAAS